MQNFASSAPHLEPYALGKLSELVEELFADVRDARKKLVEHQATFFIISANDLAAEEDRAAWLRVQAVMRKVKNFGSERIPDERLTVRNTTIEHTLRSVWQLWLHAAQAVSKSSLLGSSK